MKTAIATTGNHMNARICRRFSRCHCFLILDADTARTERLVQLSGRCGRMPGSSVVRLLADAGVDTVIAGQFCERYRLALELAGIRCVERAGLVRNLITRRGIEGIAPGGQPTEAVNEG